jgi:hypothetical protein
VDVDAAVVPDRVASAIHATTCVLETVERFMHGWSAADREVFKQRVATDVLIFERLSLSELDGKVTRHTSLMSSELNKSAPFCVTNGKLEVRAQLNATLIALRQCQAAAQRKAQERRDAAFLTVRVLGYVPAAVPDARFRLAERAPEPARVGCGCVQPQERSGPRWSGGPLCAALRQAVSWPAASGRSRREKEAAADGDVAAARGQRARGQGVRRGGTQLSAR